MSVDSKSLQTLLEGINADPGVTEEDIVRLAKHPLGPVPHKCMIEARRFDSPVLSLCLGTDWFGENGVWVSRVSEDGKHIVEGPKGQKITLPFEASSDSVNCELRGTIDQAPVTRVTTWMGNSAPKYFVCVGERSFPAASSTNVVANDTVFFLGGTPEHQTLMHYFNGDVHEIAKGVPEKTFELAFTNDRVACIYGKKDGQEPTMMHIGYYAGAPWVHGPRLGRVYVHKGSLRFRQFDSLEYGKIPYPDVWTDDYKFVAPGRFAITRSGRNNLFHYGVTNPTKQDDRAHDIAVPAGPGFNILSRPFFHRNGRWCYWGALGNVVYLMELDFSS